MLKLEKGYKLSITKVEEQTTKEGIRYLKLGGALYQKIVPFASEKSILNKTYFGKIMLFGDDNYLDEVKKRVWSLYSNDKATSVKIDLLEVYVYNCYIATQKRILSMLVIAQSNFDKDKMKEIKFSETPLISNYYLSPKTKTVEEKENKPKTTNTTGKKRGRPKKVKEEVKVEVYVPTPEKEEIKEEHIEPPTSDFLNGFLKSIK